MPHFTPLKRMCLVFLFSVALAGISGANTEFANKKIRGGSDVPSGALRFMALLWFDDDGDGLAEPFCSGTYIGDNWILTAAHCFSGSNSARQRVESLGVLQGVVDIQSGNLQLAEVDSLVLHPEFNADTRVADIALIKLKQPYFGPAVSIPAKSNSLPSPGTVLTAAGWGRTSENGSSSGVLQQVDLSSRSQIACYGVFGDVVDLNATFCAGGDPLGERDTCNGDSGGPLFALHNGLPLQLGIVNFGIGCARPGISALYTRVSHYSDWIVNNVDFEIKRDSTSLQLAVPDNYPVLRENTPQTGTVNIGEDVIFETTGYQLVSLSSQAGDSDLYIFAGDTFDDSEFTCKSEALSADSTEDKCHIDANSKRTFAGVFGFTSSDYSISVSEPDGSVASGQENSSGGSGGGVLSWGMLLLSLLFFVRYSHRCALPAHNFD